MSAREAIGTYYSLFGIRGVVLAARARALHRQTRATIAVPGLKHPVHLRLRTSDISVFRQVLVTREYDAEFCRPLRIIVDAGANVGLTSVFFANKYPEATIVAIEPEPSNFEMLKRNIAPYRNIIGVRAALWKDNEEVRLIDPDLGQYAFRTTEAPRPQASQQECRLVRGVTMGALISEFHLNYVDMLKIDVEGSEKEVFETSDSWIDSVGVIVAELHDEIRQGCARSVYRAAKSFEIEWRKGETVFLARREYALQDAPQPTVSVAAKDMSAGPVRSEPRLKITEQS